MASIRSNTMLVNFHLSSVSAFLMMVLCLGLSSGEARADKPEVQTGFGSNLALGGYDAVAYFTQGAPIKGSKAFSADYKGAVWRFVSQDNLDAFEEDPDAFAPRYGGYCAWAMAMGNLAKGDPKVWTIYEGALYLNVNKSIQKKWLKDVPGFIAMADENWPGILAR